MSAADWLAGGLTVAFAGAGVANALGVGSVRDDFRRWGYPDGFHRLTGAIEIIGSLLLLHPTSRTAGALMLGATMAAALATLIQHRASIGHLAPAAVLAIGLLWLLAIG